MAEELSQSLKRWGRDGERLDLERAREGEDLQSRHEHLGDVGIGDWSKAADRWPSQPSASPSRGAGGRRGARCRRRKQWCDSS